MNSDLKPLQQYIRGVENTFATGMASEHSYRHALKALIEALAEGIIATNEPTHIECGAPDFVITKGSVTIGYIEAKDVGENLDQAERSEQLRRYRGSLTNLVLTDYLEFRWYTDGELRDKARLGTLTREGKIRRDKDGIEKLDRLLADFLAHTAEPVGTPKELAERMARLAHMIRDVVVTAFKKELASPSLRNLHKAFCDTLIPNLSVPEFADMYAQTVAYGLFAARCSDNGPAPFTRQSARDLVPNTNPFLQKLFYHDIAGPELDDRIVWLVDDLAQLLGQADMSSILQDFGKRTAKEDPVVHFYETFLKEYDPQVRQMRGVYYTPEPVVSYIVRSIDHILKTSFGKPQGLADEKTLILDPATGTATFLYMVINEIHQSIVNQGQQGLWNEYVADKLLPRIFGFELLMAPYAMAHLKLGLLLKETGYQFEKEQRLGIYLTNTLEEAIKRSETLFAAWITEEANAAARVKKDEPIMVVLGNPPYSVSSLNRGEWIDALLEDYKQGLHERKLNIDDDYIKFIRFAQWRIEQTDYGILGFITNNSYLDGLTHRRMRECLLESFSEIYILNLHGSSRRGEKSPENIKDENVFDIRQGVAIAIFVKSDAGDRSKCVRYADLWGRRDEKYLFLSLNDISTTEWQNLEPEATPYFFFVPKKLEFKWEFSKCWSLANMFGTGDSQKDRGKFWASGIKTNRDDLLVDSDKNALARRIELLADTSLSDDEINVRFSLNEGPYWNTSRERQKIRNEEWRQEITEYLYRPFDRRWLLYQPNLIEIGRGGASKFVMWHMMKDNLSLCTMRQVVGDTFQHVLVCDTLNDMNVLTSHHVSQVTFPLYLYPAEGEMRFEEVHRRPNLKPEFIKTASDKLELKFVMDGKGDLMETFGPEDVFNYAYAIFHSPTYRSRYTEFLKIDFPRLPLTSDRELFKALAKKGAELVSLHLMESPLLNNLITRYPVAGSNTVDKVSYDENNQRVDINNTQYFEGVPQEVWHFHIGGYHVCHKWLKDRKGRALSYDDLTHYQKVIVALKETIRLMEEIDTLIPGWPLN